MFKDSIFDRLKITKNKKIKKRKPGISHNKTNKNTKQKFRKKRENQIKISRKKINQLAL